MNEPAADDSAAHAAEAAALLRELTETLSIVGPLNEIATDLSRPLEGRVQVLRLVERFSKWWERDGERDEPPARGETVKLDERKIQVYRYAADGHVLIGDDYENVVLSPESARRVLAKLKELIDD